jgi:hypothetical protein
MHLPTQKFSNEISIDKGLFLDIANFIRQNQLVSGAIPSNEDLSHDPWDHIESIMGLNFLEDKNSSEKAFNWLKENQNEDGSWYAKYDDIIPIEHHKPTHFAPYIAVAALHYYKIFKDKEKIKELWPTIQSSINFSLNLQNANGTIPWSIDKKGKIENDFLLTGSSSILKSIECGIVLSKTLNFQGNKNWLTAYNRLSSAIRNPKGLFDITIDRSRFSMDSYYPILSGCLTESEKEVYIAKVFNEFYIEGLGVKCVREEPWITVAETCEFIIALTMSGNVSKAKKILIEVLNISDKKNIPFMGWQFEENFFWPNEKPTWTSAALIIAADSIYDFSDGSDIFTSNQL